MNRYVLTVLLLLGLLFSAEHADAGDVTIRDARHYSHVFGETRNYRIVLPPDYEEDSSQRYPVIYYFHGWSQRYFGSFFGEDATKRERGKSKIANFVASHDVIVVRADGYNRDPDEPYYKRPYNVGPVETHRQFPIYFPELIDHIDAEYRTIADRTHRAIAGYSMGGFMAFWIAGKYPHMLSAAGSFCGSPEFMAGPKRMPVEYRHLDLYKNYDGVKVRLHYGNRDFIRSYHRNLNRIWPLVMDNYDYSVYHTDHATAGLDEMFSFFMETFENPPAPPRTWDHIDVYPNFSIRGYRVRTDRIEPGFTILEDVNKRGFRSSVRTHLPSGEYIEPVRVSVTTPPLYEPDEEYVIHDVELNSMDASRHTVRSDDDGRIQLELDGRPHEIGITRTEDDPDLRVASWDVTNMEWARTRNDVHLSVQLLNVGGAAAEGVTATLQAGSEQTKIKTKEVPYGRIGINEAQNGERPFTFHVTDTRDIERFDVTVQDQDGNTWTDTLDVRMYEEAPEIDEFKIADGKSYTVASAGTKEKTVSLGRGNGDGVANPGETIVVLIEDGDTLRRAKLISSDPHVNPNGLRLRASDSWTSYDHVGGSAKYSLPVIASDAPDGQKITFLAEYRVPNPPREHVRKRGTVTINITGSDTTPPELQRVNVPGNNVLRAKLYDGGDIKTVRVHLTSKQDENTTLDLKLRDDGRGADRIAGDHVFSKRIEEPPPGFYNVQIEAVDAHENKMEETHSEQVLLH